MDTTLFVSAVREWADHMEDHEFTEAYARAMDLFALGSPLVQQLPFPDAVTGVGVWEGRTPSELLEGLTGFLVSVAAICERDASKLRDGRELPKPGGSAGGS